MENDIQTRTIYEIPVFKEHPDDARRNSFGWQPPLFQQTTRSYVQPEAAPSTFREIPVFRQNTSPQMPPQWRSTGSHPGYETRAPAYCSTANITPTFGRGPHVTRIPVEMEDADDAPGSGVSVSRFDFAPQQKSGMLHPVSADNSESQKFSESEQVPVTIVTVQDILTGKEPEDKAPSPPSGKEISAVFDSQVEQVEESTDQCEQTDDQSAALGPSRGSPDRGLKVNPPKPGRSPSPVPPNMTLLEQIELIMAEARKQQIEVDKFVGSKKDKLFLMIEEMLTRLLIKLDRIDSEGKEEIRNARRDAVKQVQASLDLLESKASGENSDGPEQKQQKLEDESTCDNSENKSSNEAECSPESTAAIKEMTLGSELSC